MQALYVDVQNKISRLTWFPVKVKLFRSMITLWLELSAVRVSMFELDEADSERCLLEALLALLGCLLSSSAILLSSSTF